MKLTLRFPFLALLGILFCISSPSMANCRTELGGFPHLPSAEHHLELTGTKEVLYPTHSILRVEDIFLEIHAQNNFDHIAKILSLGKANPFLALSLQKAKDNHIPRISLLHYGPKVIRNLTNKLYALEANCWNAALKFHNPELPVGYTDDTEFEAALKQNFRLLGSDEHARFGDVIVFRNRYPHNTITRHAAIYLDGTYVWHKPGKEISTPWTFEKQDGVMNYYRGEHYQGLEISLYRKLK